jgi:predicted dehydrogenase
LPKSTVNTMMISRRKRMSLDPLDTVRIGIIGPSWWVNYWHLTAIQTHPDAEIVAICGEKERDAEELRAKYGPHARYYTDRDAMLDHATLDGVIVCTPNDLHHPSAMAALTHDLHVTCEKPLALNAAQAREMADEAKKRNLIGMTNFPYRDNPCVQKFREPSPAAITAGLDCATLRTGAASATEAARVSSATLAPI